ncbi:MAG TPA: hypothetical protein VGI45_22000 [Terracidiphilus sp.]|jgi:hypothetical protein
MRFPRPQIACVSALMFSLAISCPIHGSSLPDGVQANSSNDETSQAVSDTIEIPGPLRSFLRMAGISQEVTPDDVLPMLARNLSLYGYDQGKEKEYLVLVNRYVHQARDIQHLSDAKGAIHIAGCNEAPALLSVLGYKFQRACGQKNSSLITENAERAFLTIDSGFPLTDLEEALQKDQPFTYSYPGTRVPIFFKEKDWVTAISKSDHRSYNNLLDILLHDQDMDRLYAAMAKYDRETRIALSRSPGLSRLVLSAPVIDLYGSQIRIKSGHVIVPSDADKAWEELVGESPQSPGSFATHLLTKDGGWMAAYFDVLSRLNPAEQAHFTEGNRLRRFYSAYRSTAMHSDASRGVYPKNADLLILLASLKWKPDGDLEIPGGLGVWDEILTQIARSREMRAWLGRGHAWSTSGQFLETLVASSNLRSATGPVQMFLLLSAIDSQRPPERQMSDQTEELIAHRFGQFDHWLPIFAEFSTLDDAAITEFVNAADRIDGISNTTLRANALGSFQANVGLWQILARQGQIPRDQLNSSWHNALQPFLSVGSSAQLFEAARTSLRACLQAASGNGNLNQDQLIELLAGPVHDDRESQRVHHDLSGRIHAVLEDQRLASLDTLFGLYDGMLEMSHGAAVGNSLIPLAEDLREFEMPRPIFTGGEKSAWAPAVYTSRHAELQVRTDLAKVLRSSPTPAQLEAARAQLTPFLRDTLVGLNYAYYEPPGAEVLHNNPLFVRSHDFTSISVQGVNQIWGVPQLVGVGATAGGGAYLLGSLADLPYALASMEQDFIVPKNVQALIWREVVPDLLVGATVPRWWNVSQHELHFAALYQRTGEEILTTAVDNADVRGKVIDILADRMTPVRLERTERGLENRENATAMIARTPPADIFYLAVQFLKKYPNQVPAWGPAGRELVELSQRYPADASLDRLSADFGVLHSALTSSSGLLNIKPISTFGGTAGRVFAESWDSNNLYWARLADEMGYSPVQLNLLVPELTRNMIANIFASNIDDWPALLRAMEQTGEQFRQGKIALQTTTALSQQ